MTVAKHNNTILHLRDLVTSREYEVRINSEDKFSTLGSLLSRYLKKPLLDSLLLENRMTLNSFENLIASLRGEKSAIITSATELSDAEVKDIKIKLKEKFDSDFLIDVKIDSKLIGGLKIQVGSQMIDSSI